MQQTNTYEQLVLAIANNAVFNELNNATATEAQWEQQLFALRAIVDFTLADPALYALARNKHNEQCAVMLHELLWDDIFDAI
jgi:hypothetical protein